MYSGIGDIEAILVKITSYYLYFAMLFMQLWGIKAKIKPLENKHLNP